MGREIVYCGDCGRRLTGADLESGLGTRADDQVLCRDCLPAPAPATPPSSPRAVPAAARRPGSTARLQRVPKAGNRKALLIMLGAAGFGLAILAATLSLSSGGGAASPPAPREPAAATPPAPRRPAPDPRDSVRSDLERYAAEAAAKDDFGEARKLWAAARERFPGDAWRSEADAAVRKIHDAAAARLEGLFAAAEPGARAALRERVVAWGFPDLTKALDAKIEALTATLTLSPPRVKNGKAYAWYAPKAGEPVYLDRQHQLVSLPAFLADTTALRAANDDKAVKDAGFLRFDASLDVVVYAGCDLRISNPAWRKDFKDSGQQIVIRERAGTTVVERAMRIWERSFPAGPIELGGPDSDKCNTYILFVRPKR